MKGIVLGGLYTGLFAKKPISVYESPKRSCIGVHKLYVKNVAKTKKLKRLRKRFRV